MMNILLVDDNADYLQLLKEGLNLSGYEVHTANDGIEGCEMLTSLDIDLIISDIRMPRLDGVKLHAFAREMKRHKRTKFIFLSGFKEIYQTVPGLDAEIDYFLDKTTPVSGIRELVDRLLFGNFAGRI